MNIVTLDTVANDLRDPSLQLESALEGMKITESTSLVNDLEMDSIAVVDLIVFLENKYDVRIGDDRLASVDTVGDVVKLLNELVDVR